MLDIMLLKQKIENGSFNDIIKTVYCAKDSELQNYRDRLCNVLNNFEKNFSQHKQAEMFSAPGRTEIGGNHTDHQHGHVLAASVNLDVLAAVAVNDDNVIRILSEGYPMDTIDLTDLSVHENEKNTSAALIRGIAAKISDMGYKVFGFDAYTSSNVLKGSGLSSSAAFEVLVGVIIDRLFCKSKLGAVEIAKIGQWAENVYFGKPCGLMDQMASSVGGVIAIDFKNPIKPKIEKINFDFMAAQHALCIIDTGADHADLTGEYAAIPAEMCTVAKLLGGNVLRDVSKAQLMTNVKKIRLKAGDRAVLRALHYFDDDERAKNQAYALQHNDFDAFLKLVTKSGYSSYMYLQNVYCNKNSAEQSVAVVLAVCEQLLCGRGACRVHGGGFAGTVQAFVPLDMLQVFVMGMEELLGTAKCHVLNIRPVGGTLLF